jgi:hypothetical protein
VACIMSLNSLDQHGQQILFHSEVNILSIK